MLKSCTNQHYPLIRKVIIASCIADVMSVCSLLSLQRKRVNIGIELVAAPRLLLLDEPTSGLDASAAAALVATLLSVVRSQQVTTAAAVHQPRHEAFSLFDDLLLLGKSGRTAYYGPVAEVEGYLLGLGLEIPLHTNPADAIMDLLSGERVGSGDVATGPDVLVNAWEERSRGATSDEGQEGSAAHDDAPIDIEEAADGEVSSESSWIPVVHPEGGLGYHPLPAAPPTQPPPLPSHSPSSKTEAVALHHHRTAPGFIQQFWWCLQRAALKRSREPLQAFLDVSLVALTGLTVGLLSDRGRASIMSYAANITFSVVALSLLAMVGAVPTFSQDALAFRREAASGLHRGAFFCALDVFDLMGSCVRVGAYLVMWVSFASPRAVLWQLYLVAVALFYACTGTAYVLSLSVGPSTAQLASAVITLVATLVARQVGARGAVYAAQQFTFSRWALEGLVIAESNRLTGVWLLARCADLAALGYDVRRFWLCLTALVGQGLAARAAAYCLLLRE